VCRSGRSRTVICLFSLPASRIQCNVAYSPNRILSRALNTGVALVLREVERQPFSSCVRCSVLEGPTTADGTTLLACPVVFNCIATILDEPKRLRTVLIQGMSRNIRTPVASVCQETILTPRPGNCYRRNGCRVLDETVRTSPDGVHACQRYDQTIVAAYCPRNIWGCSTRVMEGPLFRRIGSGAGKAR